MVPLRTSGLLAAVVATLLASCGPPPKKAEPPAAKAPAILAQSPVPVTVPVPVIDRAALLEAVTESAAAYAVGKPPPKLERDLAGRRFSVKLPFGCFGPRPQSTLGYVYGDATQSLKVTAKPEQWGESTVIKALLGTAETESIEGFWISRPWILSSDCPVVAAAVAPTDDTEAKVTSVANDTAPETVGLASVFEKDGSRLLRRGALPYEVVRKTSPPGAGGFRLVLDGRVVTTPEGRSIVCRAEHADQRPICLVRVEFDRVAIESPSGEVYGEWRN